MHNKRKQGQEAEAIAIEKLKDLGYTILEQNFYMRFGEVDIIAMDRDILCFIEVKSRKNSTCGDPLESVTPKKQKTIQTIANYYLASNDLDEVQVRFDVVSISGEYLDQIEVIVDAFGVNY